MILKIKSLEKIVDKATNCLKNKTTQLPQNLEEGNFAYNGTGCIKYIHEFTPLIFMVTKTVTHIYNLTSFYVYFCLWRDRILTRTIIFMYCFQSLMQTRTMILLEKFSAVGGFSFVLLFMLVNTNYTTAFSVHFK